MRKWRIATAGISALALGGCTLLATGFASQPPGVNKHSFRQCLLHNGFFTDTALIGQSKSTAEARWVRQAAKREPKSARLGC